MKLSHLLNEERNHSERQHLTLFELQEEIEQFERDYVFLLQSSIRFTFRDGCEMMEVYQYGVDRHKARVLSLLEKARKVNPSLPAYDGVSKFMTHVDSLGFKHCISDKGLILHYICRQLHQFYSTHLITYKQHENHWKNYLRRHGNNLQSTKELKSLVRGGIPSHLRHLVWSALCRQKVKDVIIEKGCHYYNNLCSLAPESEVVSENRRQIGLDLLRTIPNNVRFSDPNADGVRKMQEVLQAFCLHNPSLGYCQGMNFLVGMCLLFLEPEDAFWCLVAVTEKYFTPNYFDQNLIGAQADQEVLKDLLKEKLPKLHNHLESNDIEISTITLNWFLAVFFDAVPFEVLLRVWDCFLLEGPKVLFRFTLAVLKMQEDAILARSDTVSIMRQIKVAAKLCFDVDMLVKTTFEELEPFPRRQDIAARQACYQRTLLEKSKKREMERKAIKERETALADFDEEPSQFIMECAAVYDKDKIWLCHGHQNRSQLSKVTCDESIMYRLNIEFDTRVMCMYALDDDTMLLGSLSHFVYAYSTKSRKLIWEIRLNDSVLSLCFHDEDGIKKVYAGLADGTLAVIENIQGISPQPESFYIMIGPSPVTCLQRVTTRLWCASGNRVIILNVRTLDVVDQFHISTSVLDYISMLVLGEHGVWVSIRGSPLIQLWDLNSLTCRLLYDVRENRYPKAPRKEEENGVKSSRVTSLLPFDGSLLVGTGEGALIIFDVVTRLSCNSSAANSPFPCLQSPNIATGDQIQEKIQELFMEQQKVEQKTELRFSDKKQERYRKDSGCYTSTTPTSVVSLSRRPSLFPTCDNDQPLLSNNISSPCKTSSSSVQQSDSSGQLSNDTVVSVYRPEGMNTKPEKQRTGEDNNIRNDETADNAGVSYADVNSLFLDSQSIARENHEPHTEDDESTWSAREKGSKYPFVDTVDQTQSDCPYRSSRAAEEVGQERTSEGMCKYEEEGNVVAEKINVSKNSNLENHSSFLTSLTVDAANDPKMKLDKSKETYSNSHEARMAYSCEQHSELTGNQSTDMTPLGSSESVSGCSHLDKSFAFPSVKPPSQKKILSTSSKFLKRSHSLGDLYCLRNTSVLKRTVLTTTSTEGLHKYKSADSLSVSGVSDGFDFDDVFITYTEDDSHKPSRITSKTPEINELTAPTCFEIRRYSHKHKLTVNNYFTNRLSLQSSEIARLLPIGLQSSTFLKPNLPDIRDQLPSWYKDGLITESDSSLLPVVRIDSEASLPKNESCSSFYMYMAQASTTSNRASGEEFSTPVTENEGLFRHNLLRPDDFSSSSTQKYSDTASNVSFGSSEFPYAYELILQEKIKISDKPIRCLLLTQCEEGPTIISCAGCYGDDEAVLKWTKEGTEKLWTNDPVIEVCPYTNAIKPSPYARSRMPRRSSINMGNVVSFSGASELEASPARAVWPSVMSSASNATSVMGSGLAKVHNMFSRTQEKS
ncbi:uncharacterized protein LOC143227975 [Tachypleus tridentatus]|uniref:uncharacterized protein LOC143227975 n=1 Tax=Tachypleus tridentatus TaxID=6853 RepID=UPI003FCF74A1